MLAALVFAIACDDGASNGISADGAVDATSGRADRGTLPDMVLPDMAKPDMARPDMAILPDAAIDMAPDPDMAIPDMAIPPDMTPPAADMAPPAADMGGCTPESCGPDAVCGADGACVPRCLAGECGNGHCGVEGSCLEGPCNSDDSCVADSYCGDGGQCAVGCRVGGCADNERCDLDTRACIACVPEVCGNDLDEDCDGEVEDIDVCGCMPGDEICDGRDNDCDGTTDETFPDAGQVCPGGQGACAGTGRWACEVGVQVCTGLDDAISPEICDDVDNDCDGSSDEGFELAAPCMVGEGVCAAAGRTRCTADGAAVECDVQAGAPGVEACNSADDDCDGDTDEDWPNLAEVCFAGAGVCRAEGVVVCTADGAACDAVAGAAGEEVCNGVDDDCDGATDEGPDGQPIVLPCYSGPDGTLDVGLCRGGSATCVGGFPGACEGEVGPAAEICDAIDNDCNGVPDDRAGGCDCVPNDSRPCYAGPAETEGVGDCRGGLQTCAPDGSGWGACDGQTVPAAEVCGGGDEDCNGLTDDAPGVGDDCADGVGACAAEGVRACQGGAVECSAVAGQAGDEVCNTIDDDCDGTVDEGLGGAACTQGEGACAQDGLMVCADGAMACDAVAGMGTPEICNGIDDDCDGSGDEGFGLGEPCQTGAAVCVSDGVLVCDPEGGVLCDAPAPVGVDEECNGLDDDCDDVVDEDTCIVDNGPPVVDLRTSQFGGNPGTLIRITVDAVDDVGVVECSLTINGVPVALDDNCEVRYTFNDSGVQRLVGTARDAAGNVGSDTAIVRVFDPNDMDSPTVAFVAPRRNSDLNTPTMVTGTVQDANLVEWEFTWGPEGDTSANFIARGDTNLDAGELGILPAHAMPVGVIFMRLSAVDVNGRRRTTTRSMNIVNCVPQAEVCDGFDNDCDDAIDEGGFDCNDNNVNDQCELADGRLLDCDGNTAPDVCDIASGRRDDCDANGVPDRCDIAGGARDCDDDGVMDRCNDECPIDVIPPTIDVVVNDVDLAVDPGVPTRITVLADDNVGVASCALFINDAPVVVNQFCRVDHVFPVTGFYTLRGVVRDAAGNEVREEVVVRVFDPNDLDIPVLSIAQPAENALVNAAAQIDVIGSIADSNLVSWRLTYGLAGQAEDVLLAEGAVEVDADVLGLLDVEGLPNGAYELQLQAEDINFREQVLLHPFRVDICTPTGDEVCDGVDNNCDGRIDEGPDDCDLNGVSDACDIGAGRVADCNGNGTPDSCDINAGLADCDNDGRPDVCNDECAADVTPPIADLFVGGEIVNAGTQVQIVVQGQDNVGVVECLATIDGVPLPLDANCQAIYDFPNPGLVTVEGIVRDAAGNQDVDSAQVRVLDPNDVDPPTIVLTSPAPGAQLSFATTIRGTVQDPNLVSWASSYGPVGNPEANAIAQGDGPVNNGPLGVIDVANIAEGDYELRIFAVDVNGRGLILVSPFTVGVCAPAAEVCDGADNDCDRSTDEGFDGLGDACTSGLGICARQGTTQCFVDGSGTGCNAQPGPPEANERCDNLDRDCDGSATNGFNVGAPCTAGLGVCARDGVQQCTAEGDDVACSAAAGAPGNEICDHLDNDCDGTLDEGFAGVQCGQGQCQRFLANCPDDPAPECDPFEGAALERCNGLDDDCDGRIDEEAAGTGDPCGIGQGACESEGVEACVDAQIVCDAAVIAPGVEECNQIDDDCDGPIDEAGVCPDVDPPVVNIFLDVQVANPGQPVTIAVQAEDDSGIDDIVITVGGVPLQVNNNAAVFQTDDPGVYLVEVTVTDTEGNAVTETAQVRVRDNGDDVAPVVNIVRPTANQLIPEKGEVEATIVDDNFFEYVIRVAPVDTEDWIEVVRARAIPVDNILGSIDATQLVNGLYRAQVIAEDVNGLRGVDEVVVIIEGAAKVGLFTITYTDMSVPVAGMPLTVERTYDSRVKSRGDFGVGWSLKVKQGKFEHNRDQAEGWEFVNGGGFFNFPCEGGAVEDGIHTTELRVADKERYAFRLQAFNAGAIQGGCFGFADYEFVFGSIPGAATLQIIGNNRFLYLNGDQRLYTDDLADDFTIDRVRLTTPDKRVFDFGKDEDGIFRLEDKNANQVSIQSNGLIHSAGKSVDFIRDGQGRITSIVAPNGQRRTYEYDGRGDLVAATDQLGNVTRYTYDATHNLQNITDPSGNTPARQIYDEDGRLVAIEYGDGARLEMDHDPDNRVEVVRDRLGNVEIFE
ncbi:MAG: YD repeat-containing protein, partial [Bradymonadia bacterium]